MAFDITTQWEVRTTGDDTNGGGYSSGGTDYSQQDSPQVTYTDLVIDAVTNTNCTSAANPFTSAHIGNIINITSGTGFTVQRVQIVSVAAGVATCDKSLGTLSSTGGNGKLGGAVATIGVLGAIIYAGNTIWVKGTGFTTTSTWTLSVAGDATSGRIYTKGYGSTRGDKGLAVITCSTNSVTVLSNTASYNSVENIKIVHNAATRGICFNAPSVTGLTYFNCVADGGSNGFIVNTAYAIACIAKNCTSHGFATQNSGTWVIEDCWSINNTGAGFEAGISTSNIRARRCVAVDNGADGFLCAGSSHNYIGQFDSCIAANNGGDGIECRASNFVESYRISNCILYGNGGWGISNSDATSTTLPPISAYYKPHVYGNAFGSNTSGTYNRSSFASDDDITLTADPFTNLASYDLSLNNTAGGGAELRAAFRYNDFSAEAFGNISYRDLSAIQHEDTGGGGGGSVKGMRVMGG